MKKSRRTLRLSLPSLHGLVLFEVAARNLNFSKAVDLVTHSFISYVDPHRFRLGWGEWLRGLGVELPRRLQVHMQVNDSLVALKAAEAGEAIALGWRPIIDAALEHGRPVDVVRDKLLTGRHHYALMSESAMRRRLLRQFCNWLAAER